MEGLLNALNWCHDINIHPIARTVNYGKPVCLIDAVVTGSPAGTIHVWNASETELPPQPSESTHGFGISLAIELARKLGSLPERLRVYGIEAENFDLGATPSPGVQRAVKDLSEKISAECEPPISRQSSCARVTCYRLP